MWMAIHHSIALLIKVCLVFWCPEPHSGQSHSHGDTESHGDIKEVSDKESVKCDSLIPTSHNDSVKILDVVCR